MSPAPKISQEGVPSAVSRVLHSGRVWIIQGIGTLLVLALAYGCYRIGQNNWWRLAIAILLALLFGYIAVFIQRTALRVFRRERLQAASQGGRRAKARHRSLAEWLPDAAFIFVLFVALVGLEAVIRQALPGALESAARWLTESLARPLDFHALEARAVSFEILVGWFLFVLLWLPLAAAAFLGERKLWSAAGRAWRQTRYWLGTLASFLVGYLAGWKFSRWLLEQYSNGGAAAGVLAGLVLAYAIALGAWLVILALAEEAVFSTEPRSLDDTWD